jgi:hypothetical protein
VVKASGLGPDHASGSGSTPLVFIQLFLLQFPLFFILLKVIFLSILNYLQEQIKVFGGILFSTAVLREI